MRTVCFVCALGLIFLRFSFLPETIEYFTGVHTYLLYIFGPPALLGVMAFGSLKRALNNNPVKFWLAFLAWMVLAIPFSSWRGDSLGLVLSYLRTDFIMLLVIAGLAVNWAECRMMIYVIALAALVNIGTAQLLMAQTTGGDRVMLESNGMISDPNDLAAHLLLVLPFVAFVALRHRTSIILRVILGSAIIFGLFLMLRSGSRGGFIALVFTVILAIVFVTPRQRLIVALVTPALLLALIAALPEATWQRFKSITSDSDASEAAETSREARIYLLEKSIEYTVKNPIFGVGPGQFQNFEGMQATAEGRHGAWHATHNTFTQISSECGIPALVFFLGAIISSFRALWRTHKRAVAMKEKEVVLAVTCISLGFAGYTAASFFLANGYRFQFLAISGLIVALNRIVAKYAAKYSVEEMDQELNPSESAEAYLLNA